MKQILAWDSRQEVVRAICTIDDALNPVEVFFQHIVGRASELLAISKDEAERLVDDGDGSQVQYDIIYGEGHAVIRYIGGEEHLSLTDVPAIKLRWTGRLDGDMDMDILECWGTAFYVDPGWLHAWCMEQASDGDGAENEVAGDALYEDMDEARMEDAANAALCNVAASRIQAAKGAFQYERAIATLRELQDEIAEAGASGLLTVTADGWFIGCDVEAYEVRMAGDGDGPAVPERDARLAVSAWLSGYCAATGKKARRNFMRGTA